MDKMKKLKDKKGMHKMHPLEQKAKMGVVHDMQKMAHDAMSGKLKGGMNKVSVMSNTKDGLQSGLDKAGQALKHLPDGYDSSNPDHLHANMTKNPMDGEDGMSSHMDATHDDENDQLMAEGGEIFDTTEQAPPVHEFTDETEEGAPLDERMTLLADGGEVGDEDHENDNSSSEASELPNYDDMDDGNAARHLKALVSALQKKGLV